MTERRIIVALDVSNATELRELVEQIKGADCRVKIGKELFTSIGPLAIEICHDAGLDVFWILNFTTSQIHVRKQFGQPHDGECG